MSAQAKQTHKRQLAALQQQLEQSLIYQERLQKMLAIEEKELAEAEQERRKKQKPRAIKKAH